MRRPLWETVLELMESVLPVANEESLIQVVNVWMDLPLEVTLQRRGSELALLGDLPRWRWRTVFDAEPGRLQLRCGEGEVQ